MYTKMCTVLSCCCCNYMIFVLCEYDSTGKHIKKIMLKGVILILRYMYIFLKC